MSATATPKTEKERYESLMERLEKQKGVQGVTTTQKSFGSVVSYYEGVGEGLSHATPAQMKSLNKRLRNFKRLGDLEEAGYQSQYKSARDFLTRIREYGTDKDSNGGREHREMHDRSITLLKSAMGFGSSEKSVGMNTFDADSAGALILPEFHNEIISSSYTNDLWQRTRGFTVSGNRMTFPKLKDNDRRSNLRDANGNLIQRRRGGGIEGFWRGEEMNLLASQAEIETVELKLNKLAVVMFVSDELIEDTAYALTQYLSQGTREEFDFMLGDAVYRGDGIGKPLGILNSPATITVAPQPGQPARTLRGQNIEDMYRRRIGSKTANYVWLYNQTIEPQLANLMLEGETADSAQLTYLPAGHQSAPPNGSLKGLPLVPCEFCSPLGTRGDIALVDLNEFFTISKGGITESTSTEVAWLTDQMAYKFTQRVDGRPCEDRPIKPYQGDPETDTQSAFIVLGDRPAA